ncbi:PREDICTED: protein ZBED8-like, partial [Rhagoletis zephyria]|uniref:protein ZBED8-like n=1 Tax=Rhagoletis zephyria TaxID=28612 RepID=UPI0008119C7C
EITDVCDVSQLIVCIRIVDDEFNIQEDMLCLRGLHNNATGKNIYEIVEQQLFSFAEKNKLSSIYTDGAPVMTGKREGFVGQLIRNGVNVPVFHCMLHQQQLLAKSFKIRQTMQVSVKIIKRIRGGHNALTHRKFRSFLEEIDADFGDILLYTE